MSKGIFDRLADAVVSPERSAVAGSDGPRSAEPSTPAHAPSGCNGRNGWLEVPAFVSSAGALAGYLDGNSIHLHADLDYSNPTTMRDVNQAYEAATRIRKATAKLLSEGSAAVPKRSRPKAARTPMSGQ
jgi:hypothetical protein